MNDRVDSISVVVAVSGGLGFECLKHIVGQEDVKAILTDRLSSRIIEFAEETNIPLFVGNPREGRAATFLSINPAGLLLSINYVFIFDQGILECFDAAVNIHGSLLPKYRGRTPHVWAIINNESVCGITAHLISLDCDAGNILIQDEIKILEEDTGGSILEKYSSRYPFIIDEIFDLVKLGDLSGKPQNESMATYFGKRTSDDGLIIWAWQRERIRNWVRAQTRPYPGAFAFLGTEKIIVWQVRFSDYGFRSDMIDGTILCKRSNSFIVKTPNGCLEIVDFEMPSPLTILKEGMVLK